MPRLPLAAALVLAVSSPALAQTPAPSGQFLTEAPHTFRLSKLKGVGVIGLDHTRLGDIQDLLIDAQGQVRTAIIDVGGVLGMGSRRVAVPFSQILWNTGDVSRQPGPDGSTAPGQAGSGAATPQGGAERMPGANVGNEVLNVTAEQRSAEVNPASGQVAPENAPGQRATVLLIPADGSVRNAAIRATKAELERAPEFKFR
jgi:sporulation protein YlmC with PRC-barrel domain